MFEAVLTQLTYTLQGGKVAQTTDSAEKVKVVTILVNNQPVTVQQTEVTGLQIKQAAIDQGVAIETDFQLFEKQGEGKLTLISDTKTIKIHEREEFRATAPDDNS
jgi:Multiubiquitin